MPISAYKRTITETENPRQIERRVMSRINAKLKDACETFDAGDAAARLQMLANGLRDTLAENEKLWSVLKQDLISPSNQMTSELRSSLISMAMFVERHTGAVLSGHGNIKALIDVNSPIIDGLSGVSGEVG